MDLNLPKLEEQILAFWREKNIFAKTLAKTKNGKPFVFFEGPPTANAKPGIHHMLSRILKDIIPRYKTMNGYYVERKAGWDTHGLPVELEMEKKLGIKGKPEIEKYGIAEFNAKCKESIWQYKKEWEDLSERIGFWLDYEHAYITYENYYIETLWWILKQIWDKKLLFQDYKVVPHCPRCGTTLSSHEVALGYKSITEKSIYIKLKVKNQENTYLLVWTTTPWTLPGNLAVAVGKNIDYVKVSGVLDINKRAKGGKIEYQNLIIAKEIFDKLGNEKIPKPLTIGFDLAYIHKIKDGEKVISGYKSIQNFKGSDLAGLEYEPLFDIYKNDSYFKIYAGDFITTEEGTGLVHIAPHFGEDDYNLFIKNKLRIPELLTVNSQGMMTTSEIPGDRKFVKDAETDIVDYLEKKYLLLISEDYKHDYPFCWRCKSPLIYYAKKSWFIKMSEPRVKEQLLKNNETINWIPDFIKHGRFGVWLQEVKDWALSRERYWGTPLPIWICEKCEHRICLGSFEEVEKKSGKKVKDPHRPFVDEIKIKCEKCGGEMKRVPEVIDCWFDSGAMPFAQHHYPFENKERYEKGEVYPADFIAEGLDQTRGWFYTLLAISTLLEKEPSYKNVICNGLVLDENGEKMSKSRGNVIDPWKMIEKYGVDALRFYFYSVNQPNDSKYFSEKQVDSIVKKVFLILWNVISFYQMYVGGSKIDNLDDKDLKNVLDKWIVAKLNLLIQEVSKKLDAYDIMAATRDIAFFIDELSTWYLRRSRERFKSNDEKIKISAIKTLRYVIFNLTKLMAPFTPFIAEHIYQKMKGREESIHLENWPKIHENWIDDKIISQMVTIQEIASLGLEQRAKNKIAVRQPLAKIIVKFPAIKKLDKDLEQIVLDELNIKKIEYQTNAEKSVELDLNISPALKEEGIIRELIRQINDLRKKSDLTINDQVEIVYQTESESLFKIISKNSADIQRQTIAQKIEKGDRLFAKQKEIVIDNQKIILSLD